MSDIVEDKDIFTEEEVWNWLKFAQSLGSMTGMPLTIDLINSRMKDVTLTSGVGGVTEDQVSKALSNPKESEQDLLRISETLAITSIPYRRILEYLAGLPSFDFTYYCKNIKKAEEYKSPKYRKDLDVLKTFLDRFDYKKEFATALFQMLREETFFCVLRDEGETYTLQQLPSDRCKITGRMPHGLLFSFDMNWFRQGGVSLDGYPDVFKKMFTRAFIDGKPVYDPFGAIDLRSDSSWVYWVDCSPNDGFWGWKFTPEVATRIPFLSGMFPDLVMTSLVRGLQKSNYLASAVKLVSSEVPMLNPDNKSTNLKDSFGISPDLLGKFMQLIKSAINSEAVKIFTVPMQNVKGIEFSGNNDVYSDYLRTAVSTSGVNTNLLFNNDQKMNSTETLLSANVDELISQKVYPWFSRFIEYYVNRDTAHYKFGIQFEGSNFYTDRQRRIDIQSSNMDKGIVNFQKYAAAQGMNPFVLQAQLEETKAMGFVDGLTPIVSAFQTPAGEKGGRGRPKKSDSEIGESGEETRSQSANIGKGGKEV